jgi:hypothetical protein
MVKRKAAPLGISGFWTSKMREPDFNCDPCYNCIVRYN